MSSFKSDSPDLLPDASDVPPAADMRPPGKVVFSCDSVTLRWPHRVTRPVLHGTMRMVERRSRQVSARDVFLTWEANPDDEKSDDDDNHGSGAGSAGEDDPSLAPLLELCLFDLTSYRRLSDGELLLIERDGTNRGPLNFVPKAKADQLLKQLENYLTVRQSSTDANLLLLVDPQVDSVDQNLSNMNLFSSERTNEMWSMVKEFHKDPYASTMMVFSKLADRVLYNSNESGYPEEEFAHLLFRTNSLTTAPDEDIFTTTSDPNDSFEFVTLKQTFFDELPMTEPRWQPIDQDDWTNMKDGKGRVKDRKAFLRHVFKGGVKHEVRREVWKFLLGYYDYNSTEEEREQQRTKKIKEYNRMKLQWQSLSETQEDHFTAYKTRKIQIEKDVIRTDRSHPFFAGDGDENRNVKRLQDILLTYAMYNFDLGYVQGMSDLLSPLLIVLDDEVEAFWCFVEFMNRIGANFHLEQAGMRNQIGHLKLILKTVDPAFHGYLVKHEAGNFYFCFRWLLIWFKREFSMPDVLLLWETLWTRLPCPNYHLLLCLALLSGERSAIIENKFGAPEIVKHINDLANREIGLLGLLQKAETIYEKLKQEGHVEGKLKEVFTAPGDQASS